MHAAGAFNEAMNAQCVMSTNNCEESGTAESEILNAKIKKDIESLIKA